MKAIRKEFWVSNTVVYRRSIQAMMTIPHPLFVAGAIVACASICFNETFWKQLALLTNIRQRDNGPDCTMLSTLKDFVKNIWTLLFAIFVNSCTFVNIKRFSALHAFKMKCDLWFSKRRIYRHWSLVLEVSKPHNKWRDFFTCFKLLR